MSTTPASLLSPSVIISGTSSKPVDVPGSSPIPVIDGDGDSGFNASIESKLGSLFLSPMKAVVQNWKNLIFHFPKYCKATSTEETCFSLAFI